MAAGADGPTDYTALAREKMIRVLGAARAEELLRSVLAEVKLEALASPADLHRFGHALSLRGAFEGAVGALLCLQASICGYGRG